MAGHASQAYPEECCGLCFGRLEGESALVDRILPMENVAKGLRTLHFELDPLAIVEAERAAHHEGMVLIGVYHSHPNAEASFSRADQEGACSWYVVVIVSVRGGSFEEARAFQVSDDLSTVTELPLFTPLEPT